MQFATRLNRGPDDPEIVRCAGCGRKIDTHADDYHEIDDECYCMDCVSSLTVCDRCGREILLSDAKRVKDGETLCEYCYDDLYVTV